MNEKDRARSRTSWIDAARGIGIILVVAAHVERGLIEAKLMPASPTYLLADELIYSFHMPLFFFISGLFVSHMMRQSRTKIITDKLITIVWPYFFWSFLHISVVMMVGSNINEPLNFNNMANLPWIPIAQYWFLYALFICHITIIMLWPHRYALAIFALLGATLSAMLGIGNILLHTLQEAPFFIAGALAGPWLLASAPNIRSIALILMTGAWALFAALFAAKTYWLADVHSQAIVAYCAACAGIVGTLMVAMLVANRTPWLCRLGQASMAIYVAHTFFAAGLRISTQRLGIAVDPLLLLVIASVVGIGGPWLLYRWAGSHGITTLLGLGKYVRA